MIFFNSDIPSERYDLLKVQSETLRRETPKPLVRTVDLYPNLNPTERGIMCMAGIKLANHPHEIQMWPDTPNNR